MSEYGEGIISRLHPLSPLKNENNAGHKFIDNTIGEYLDNYENRDKFDQLFLRSATGKWLDLHGKELGVYREIDEADEKSVITAAVKKFGENFRSRISDQMYFLTKTVYGCPECQRNIKYITSFHCAFCLHPERAANWLNKKDLDLYDLFSHTTKNRLFYDVKMDCKFCRKVQKDIYIKKIYYTSPINMIVGMDSSKDDKFNIKIEEYINLSNFVERTDICKTNYRLIGAIFNEKNEDDDSMKYISYTKDTNGHWKYFNGKSMQNSNFDEVKNHKHLLSLFYTSL